MGRELAELVDENALAHWKRARRVAIVARDEADSTLVLLLASCRGELEHGGRRRRTGELARTSTDFHDRVVARRIEDERSRAPAQ